MLFSFMTGFDLPQTHNVINRKEKLGQKFSLYFFTIIIFNELACIEVILVYRKFVRFNKSVRFIYGVIRTVRLNFSLDLFMG